MSLRTVLIVLACILIAAPIIAAGADDPDQATKPPDRPAVTPQADGADVKRAIVADDDIVRARVGQRLELEVESDTDDSVQAFGQTEAVSPESPARFSIQLDEVGTHGIVRVSDDERLGRVVVTEPEPPEAAQPKAEPAPKTDPERSPPDVSGGTEPGA